MYNRVIPKIPPNCGYGAQFWQNWGQNKKISGWKTAHKKKKKKKKEMTKLVSSPKLVLTKVSPPVFGYALLSTFTVAHNFSSFIESSLVRIKSCKSCDWGYLSKPYPILLTLMAIYSNWG
jgi:hypothetical protein